MIKFKEFKAALAWGKTYGKECVLPCYKWEIEKIGKWWFVAIKSKTTGELIEYAAA